MQLNFGSQIKPVGSQDDPYCTFFLFINSGSGGGLGKKLVSQQIRKIEFDIPIDNETDIRPIDVYFINMRKNRDYGFNKLKRHIDMGKKTISVICGGDGTVTWVVSQLSKHNIDPMKAPLAVIPLGTGNDFSRNLNWGPQKTMLLQHNFRSLKKLIRKWLHASQQLFDIWDVTAQVYDNGKFQKVQNCQSTLIEGKILKKSFANYFSFGIDGKVGYSFDMHRTSSRVGNLAMYGALGIIKQATKSKTIDELIQSFVVKQRVDNDLCIFKTKLKTQKQIKQQQEKETKTQYITPGLKNILALNIDSYTGGVKDIWTSGKEIFSNVDPLTRSIPTHSDGKLQIVSFASGTAIAMERSIGGFANRIAQHTGPFIFNFRKYPEEEKHRTYLQIDGQFIRFTHPQRVTIQKSTLIENGKIKVLWNNPQFEPYIPSNQ